MSTTFLIIFIGVFIVLVPISMLVETMRAKPVAPSNLEWLPDVPVQYIEIDGVNVRYVKTGTGPTLLLLHTLRTHLDIFQKIIPALARNFTVYALDYPGHGWSDIPDADYSPEFFNNSVNKFLDKLDLTEVLVAGVSIGGSIPLMLAGEGNERIKAIVAINPYDYNGRGASRGNFVARIIFTAALVPVLGETFMRLRNRLVEGKIMEGGVSTSDALPEKFLEELFITGERPGHFRAFINLIRHSYLFEKAHDVYKKIKIPVLLIYGDQDWAYKSDRDKTASGIPGAKLETVKNGGHFLSLDQPEVLIKHINRFAEQNGILN